MKKVRGGTGLRLGGGVFGGTAGLGIPWKASTSITTRRLGSMQTPGHQRMAHMEAVGRVCVRGRGLRRAAAPLSTELWRQQRKSTGAISTLAHSEVQSSSLSSSASWSDMQASNRGACEALAAGRLYVPQTRGRASSATSLSRQLQLLLVAMVVAAARTPAAAAKRRGVWRARAAGRAFRVWQQPGGRRGTTSRSMFCCWRADGAPGLDPCYALSSVTETSLGQARVLAISLAKEPASTEPIASCPSERQLAGRS